MDLVNSELNPLKGNRSYFLMTLLARPLSSRLSASSGYRMLSAITCFDRLARVARQWDVAAFCSRRLGAWVFQRLGGSPTGPGRLLGLFRPPQRS